ncbi:MAG: hypothetical protein H6944_15805 [Zoogloeaceae bacterium]|nr:hypothetical protein [Zoogloeaceae bacterium]HQU89587.1 hypothetical protein [Denitromonas sp.]
MKMKSDGRARGDVLPMQSQSWAFTESGAADQAPSTDGTIRLRWTA